MVSLAQLTTTMDTYPHHLGDGYQLRWGTPADAEAYAQLATSAFFLKEEGVANPNVAGYAYDLLSDRHPLCRASDVAVVVDATQRLVAAAALMRQPLEYQGLPIATGRPELVCSHADVRDRGLIRYIMHALHHKSTVRGDVLQAITGIPHYYHQFGYTWSVDHKEFVRIELAQLPPLPDDAPVVTIRQVTTDNFAQFAAMYDADRHQRGVLLTAPYTIDYFQHLVAQSHSSESYLPYLCTNQRGQAIGYVLIGRRNWGGVVTVTGLGINHDSRWLECALPILHALPSIIHTLPKVLHSHPEVHSVDIQVDGMHPLITICQQLRIPHLRKAPFQWYMRMSDPTAFLGQIRGILEHRIATSAFAGYSGVLRLSTYRATCTLEWRNGHLTRITPLSAPVSGESDVDAAYPPECVAQQLLGWRSLAELREWRPDVWATPTATPLLEVLFPKQPSWLLWMN